MSAVPTVRIQSDIPGCENGLDINESDFDPEVHVLFNVSTTVPDRDAVALMSKGEVREWLEATDTIIPKGATVGQMRDMLTRAMFVDG